MMTEIEEKGEESKSEMECSKCENEFPADELFQCQHDVCAEDENIYCEECIEWMHQKNKKKKGHTLSKRVIDIPQTDNNQPPIQSIVSTLNHHCSELNKSKFQSTKTDLNMKRYFASLASTATTITTIESHNPSIPSSLLTISDYKNCDGGCKGMFAPQDLYVCKHPDCLDCVEEMKDEDDDTTSEGQKRLVFCINCGRKDHRWKSHAFNIKNLYIHCLQPIITNIESGETGPSQNDKMISYIKSLTEDSQVLCKGVCEQKHPLKELYICKHPECVADRKILCKKCINLNHYYKSHGTYIGNDYIVCIMNLINPDQTKFDSGRLCEHILMGGNILVIHEFLFRSRWFGAVPTHLTHMGCSTGASYVKYKTVSCMAACKPGHAISMGAIKLSATAGGIGAAVATVVEWGFVWSLYHKKKISGLQALKLGGTSLAANGLSAGAFVGVMAAGAVVGAPGGPAGSFICAILVAVVVGFGTRAGINKIGAYLFKKKHEARTRLQKEALSLFFRDENYPIHNKKKFNRDKLKLKWNQLAAVTHPEVTGGDNTEWAKLSALYGILTAMCDLQEEGDGNKELSLNEQTDVINAVVTQQIVETGDTGNGDDRTLTNSDTFSSGNEILSSSGFEYSHQGSEENLLGVNE